MVKVMADSGLKMYVVSAGIKSVVKECFNILQTQKKINIEDTLIYCMTPEIFDINHNHTLVGFGEPTVTSVNKHLCINHERYPEIEAETNAILLGDLVEDCLIMKNLKIKEVIKIGFFNEVDEYEIDALDRFMSAYDVVITRDGNLSYVTKLIKSIIGFPIENDCVIYNEKI